MLKILNKFFNFSGNQRKLFYQSIVLSIFHSIFEILKIIAISIVINDLLYNTISKNTIIISFLLVLVSIIGGAFVKNSMTMKQTIGGYKLCADKRIEIGNHLKYVPMGFLNSNSLGYITSVTTNTLDSLQDVATRVVMLSTQGFINTCIISILVTFFNYNIGITLFLGIACFLIANSLMQRKSNVLSSIKTDSDSNLVESVLEYIQGISVVKSYNLSSKSYKNIDTSINDNEKINFNLEKTFIPYLGLQSFIIKFFEILVILLCIYYYTTNSMSLINCITLIISSFIIYGELETAGAYSTLLRIMDISVDKVKDVLNSPTMDINGSNITPKNYNIQFKNVTFSYENDIVLKNISFIIPENKTTAIIGPSGGGKTTICNLITRFFDVDSGQVTIGGIDVKNYKLDSLLSNISMVFQDVYLFNDTIANNIMFGTPTATRADIVNAAKKACCHDFIMSLPKGYDTIISEGGSSISGGEKQRISIARAILKDAPIVILDEATANIDPENEEKLQKAFQELTKNKTLIMIAHKLKTVKNADQILVIDSGHLVQSGTHSTLVNEDGIYKRFIDIRKQAIGWKI